MNYTEFIVNSKELLSNKNLRCVVVYFVKKEYRLIN